MTPALARLRGGDGRRSWEAWFADDAVGLRQLPTTVVTAVILVFLVLSPVPGRPGLLVAAAAIAAAVQLVGSLGRWDRWPRALQYLLPIAQMVAIGLLAVGSGYALSAFDLMLFVPVVSLSLQRGPAGLVLAIAGTAVVLLVPTVLPVVPPERVPPVVRAVADLLIVSFVAVGAHGIVSLARRQAQQLRDAHADLALGAERLRDSRDTLRSILLAATEQGFVATDGDGRIVSVNPGAERVFGRPESELLGRWVGDLRSLDVLAGRPEDAGPAAPTTRPPGPRDPGRLMGEAARGGTQEHEWACRLPDGSERRVHVVVTARPALTGTAPELPAGYLFVATDVTARYEEERRQDEFVGLVSHELRTPLASIFGYLDLLRLEDGRLDDEQRQFLAVMDRNARRLHTLVDDLLTSAQIVSGTYTLHPEEVDVAQVVREAVASELPNAQASGVAIEVAGDAAVPLVSDAERLGQVVDNLLTNAVKYSRGPGGHVVVTVASDVVADRRVARLRVSDDGTGIASDELDRVTERFYRSRDTRRRRVSGVGLGLALVDQIVHDHGGTMSIRSEPGEGTEVDVTLADLRAPTQTPAPPSARRTGGTAG
ncbi:PAS domain-containing sensor histidine kinase [Isoptericola cucumis]|uniref:sensor histidine kinase n=1 Tax=Isoptericola cucumis TaxID=1776856 RepID=UPI003207DDD4